MTPLRFSIVVPTHDRVARLRRTVEALDRLDYDPARFEVLVVDDGSTDGTAAFLAGRVRPGFQVIRRVRGGVAAARNSAIHAARGTFVAFTDDDCEVPPDWLTRLDARLEAEGLDVLGGTVENALPSVISQLYQDMARELYERQNMDAPHPEFLSANNLACRRELLLTSGLFDARFFLGGEDRELVRRLTRGGARVRYAPDLVIRHYHEFTLATFARHNYRIGRGSYLLHRVVPPAAGGARRGGAVGLYVDFVARVARTPPRGRALARLALFALAQASVTAGFLAAAAGGAGRPRGPEPAADERGPEFVQKALNARNGG